METENENYSEQYQSDDLSAQDAANMLEAAFEGETWEHPGNGGEPDATASGDDGSDAGDASDAGQEEPTITDEPTVTGGPDGAGSEELDIDKLDGDSATLLAKDGKHTIDFKVLKDERIARQEWQQRAEGLQQELDQLRAAQEAGPKGDTPEEKAQFEQQQQAMAEEAVRQGVDPSIFGDFTGEDLAKGIGQLLKSQSDELLKLMDERVNKALEPMRASEQLSAEQAVEQHWKTIFEKHPDADSIFESQELSEWIESRPYREAQQYLKVLDQGTAAEGIALLDAYKAANGSSQGSGNGAESAKAAAKKAIDGAASPVPASLSDIPGSRASDGNPANRLAGLDSPDLLEAMSDMTPEQVEEFLNRNL